MSIPLQLRSATPDDMPQIHRLRHDVYADELRQHEPRPERVLADDLDRDNVYLVAATGAEVVGFVSVTPPWLGRFSVEKYVRRDDWPLLADPALFEVRILTVREEHRGTPAAGLLMYAALRWVASRGGRRVVAMGRSDLLGLYRGVGLTRLGQRIVSGAVTFELLAGDVAAMRRLAADRYGEALSRFAATVDWRLDMPLVDDDECHHGGAFVGALGPRLDQLDRRHDVVPADVLDAWFPPSPAVVQALAEDTAWLARTSPPTAAEGLRAEISQARGVPETSVAVGAGSSDLVFRALRGWLSAGSRVLLPDPTYGEYAHVLERVIGCRVDRLPLARADGWRLDPDRLAEATRSGYDLVVLVNPNNPTGRHVGRAELVKVLSDVPERTRVWVDEAYVDYVGSEESLESFAASSPNVVVCKSLSKVYALSGLRAAYVVAAPPVAAQLRRWTPPWAVSLPAQVAAVRALRDPDHYQACWAHTARLRADLARDLAVVVGAPDVVDTAEDGVTRPGAEAATRAEVVASRANFVVVSLPAGGPCASDLVRRCRERGVYLRDLTSLSATFEQRTVRVAVRTADENRRIVDAVRAAL
jgi:histidinol-phosphate/aromatic aminotransferase/cobyric acid decarboxylase-like protein/N-acyl-L-homoserine lactone synthetase